MGVNQSDVFNNLTPKPKHVDIKSFKALPLVDRKKIIDSIVNVNGMRTPRLKSWKNMDGENYGRKIHGRMHAIVFEITVNKINKL